MRVAGRARAVGAVWLAPCVYLSIGPGWSTVPYGRLLRLRRARTLRRSKWSTTQFTSLCDG
jgi:hypothetical protein